MKGNSQTALVGGQSFVNKIMYDNVAITNGIGSK